MTPDTDLCVVHSKLLPKNERPSLKFEVQPGSRVYTLKPIISCMPELTKTQCQLKNVNSVESGVRNVSSIIQIYSGCGKPQWNAVV